MWQAFAYSYDKVSPRDKWLYLHKLLHRIGDALVWLNGRGDDFSQHYYFDLRQPDAPRRFDYGRLERPPYRAARRNRAR